MHSSVCLGKLLPDITGFVLISFLIQPLALTVGVGELYLVSYIRMRREWRVGR